MNVYRIIRRVIYLDFDGVLQHADVYVHPKKGIYIREPGFTLFEWMPILEELLKEHPDVAIVLSTSWVRSRSFNFAKRKLGHSLQERVIGATFHRYYMNSENFAMLPRGVQIALDVERRQPQAWIAIDDSFEAWPERFLENLVCTKENLGLSEPAVQEKIKAWLSRTAEV
jgi:hypothetical protein